MAHQNIQGGIIWAGWARFVLGQILTHVQPSPLNVILHFTIARSKAWPQSHNTREAGELNPQLFSGGNQWQMVDGTLLCICKFNENITVHLNE